MKSFLSMKSSTKYDTNMILRLDATLNKYDKIMQIEC